MKKFCLFLMLLIFELTISVSAQQQENELGEFQLPAIFSGEWTFKNHNTGQLFGGKMKAVLSEKMPESEPGVIAYKGFYSYDGRQTNEKCGTYGVFGSDTPVPLIWSQKSPEVVLTYELDCPFRKGRPVSIKYYLKGNNIIYEYSLPHGKGLQTMSKE
jgi:hypothetical protein